MKRILSLVLTVAVVLSLCIIFAACQKNEQRLSFGDEYVHIDGEKTKKLVFNRDGTGYIHHYEKTDFAGGFISVTRDFLWTETSNGAIHLVPNGEPRYDEGSEEDDSVTRINAPLYFSEDFIYYEFVSGAGGASTFRKRFFRHGSELYKASYEN